MSLSAEPDAAPVRRHRRELFGWLSYAFASEVFVIVSLTLFLPICLEQFARDNGFLLPDKTVPCNAPQPKDEEERRCVVRLGWMWIDSASFSLYVFSISVALQALTVISMGGVADHPPHRKRLLLGFAALGSISALLFFALPSSSSLWPLAGVLAMAANVGFGASVVAMNSYLPRLARNAPDVSATRSALDAALGNSANAADTADQVDTDASVDAPLLPATDSFPESADIAQLRAEYTAALARSTARISAHGIALGYAAGITLLLLTILPVTRAGGSTLALRCAIGASGAWWAIFSVVAGILLSATSTSDECKRDYSADASGSESWSTRREITKAWRRLGQMLRPREIRKLAQTFRYLAAWFLLSDGFTTISSTAVLFGKTTLRLPAGVLILVGVLAPAAGVVGALVWPLIQRRVGLSSLQIMVVLIALASLIPLYGCLGLIPSVRNVGLGLVSAGEMLGLAAYYGFVAGAFQSYARAVYAALVPPGEEARWFALFSITDKSSSFVGPLLVGLIADSTGNIRFAFIFLVGMFGVALPVLAGVNVEKGGEDARRYTSDTAG